MWKFRLCFLAGVLPAAAGVLIAQTAVDSDAVRRIQAEGLTRSEAPALFAALVDDIGPRLTGSREYKRAAEWSRERLETWGLSNARLEPFEFGRGWQLEHFVVEMIEPRYMPLTGFPEAWTPSTAGDVIAAPVATFGKNASEIAALATSIKGGIALA